MRPRQNKAQTKKQILQYLDGMALRVENNERAVNELTRIFKDYMEMQNEFENFAEYRERVLGLSAQIPTRWSVFKKFFKSSYLKLKKMLDF